MDQNVPGNDTVDNITRTIIDIVDQFAPEKPYTEYNIKTNGFRKN